MVTKVRRYNGGMRVVPLLLMIAGSLSSADIPVEAVLLQRARVHMSRLLSTLPNYTCLQTIERSYRSAPKRKPALLDVIRIEVALVKGRELFAWPGSGHFSDAEISDLVRGGAIGNGSFALHAKAVFQTEVPVFTYAGEQLHNGRKTLKWTFVVPLERSGFTVRVGGREAVVAYQGAMWLDVETLDAARLEVEAVDIPAWLKLDSALTAVEYARVPIGTDRFLLPSSSELKMADAGGSISLNRTAFSRCRQYSGESTLVFDDPAPDNNTEPVSRTIDAGPGMRLDLAIEHPVALRGGAIGDPVTAVLTNELTLQDGTGIPKGALVHGRITHLRPAFYMRYSALAVGLKFFEIESAGVRVRLNAVLQDLRTPNPAYLVMPQLARGVSTRPENETMFGSIFHVREYTTQLEKGLRMTWRTMPLPSEEP